MRLGGCADRSRHRACDGDHRIVGRVLSGHVRDHHVRQGLCQHGRASSPRGPWPCDSLPRRLPGARRNGGCKSRASAVDYHRRTSAQDDAAAGDIGFSVRGCIGAAEGNCRAQFGSRCLSRDDRQRVRVRAAGRISRLGQCIRCRDRRVSADVAPRASRSGVARARMAGQPRARRARTRARRVARRRRSGTESACASRICNGEAAEESMKTSGILGIRDLGLGIRTATGIGLMLGLLAPVSLSAQNVQDPTLRPRPAVPTRPTIPTQPTSASEASVAPIECWWKTDRSAVRVGENFTLTMTCAVLDTERVKVVVDESGLAPSALHLVPFDIVGGERFRDIVNAPRKFFQYQYSMRVLGEEFFGKEITLPRLQISYRVQNSLQGGAALQGREAQYSLVPVPIRVLSLVPAGTSDIRDTPVETFGDVEARLFRSNLLLIVAVVAFVLAGLMAVTLLARAAVKRHAMTPARH